MQQPVLSFAACVGNDDSRFISIQFNQEYMSLSPSKKSMQQGVCDVVFIRVSRSPTSQPRQQQPPPPVVQEATSNDLKVKPQQVLFQKC
jgi:hypothetical protein